MRTASVLHRKGQTTTTSLSLCGGTKSCRLQAFFFFFYQHRDKPDNSKQILQHIILSNTCAHVALFYFRKTRIFTSETVLKFTVGSVAPCGCSKFIFICLTLIVQRFNSIVTHAVMSVVSLVMTFMNPCLTSTHVCK